MESTELGGTKPDSSEAIRNSSAGVDADAALQLLARVQDRVGQPLSYFEWRMLNANGENTAAEFSPVEAEVFVRLLAKLGGTDWALTKEDGRAWIERYLEQVRGEVKPVKAGRWAIALPIGLGLVLAFLASLAPGVQESWGVALIGGLVLAAVLLARLFMRTERQGAIELVDAQLGRSNILERLVENDPTLEEIRHHTPVPFNWLVLGLSQKDLAERIQLVSRHLDWYLRTPRRYLRLHWLYRYAWLLAPAFLVDWPALVGGQGFKFHFSAVWLPAFVTWILGGDRQTSLETFYAGTLVEQMLERVRDRLDLPQVPSNPTVIPP